MAKSEAVVVTNNSRIQNKRQKLREERKRVARLCVSKLQNIHDPESYLCKSVLINNTLRNIQLQHREALKRTKLHRKNFPKEQDEYEAKRQCLEEGAMEGPLGEDVMVEDVGHPLCNSYYDVSQGDTGEVILCDTFTETDISSTVDISLSTTCLGDIEEESLAENLNNNNTSCSDSDPGKGGTFQVTYCIDTMTPPQSIVQNNTIELKSF